MKKPWNPLILAIVKSPFNELELISLSAYVSFLSDFRSTPLHFAALRKDKRFAQLLLREGWIPIDTTNCYLETALHWAAKSGEEEVVSLLLSFGAQVDALDSEGRSPIEWAIEEDNRHLLPLLVPRSTRATTSISLPPPSRRSRWRHWGD